MNRRVLYGRLGGQARLNAYIRSLSPAAWFRMDQGVTVTGAGISQVDDLSGNARHLLDPGTTRPIYLPYSGTRYLYLPGVSGNYASTPDSAANSITGDIDIRVRVALDDWTPSAAQLLVCKDSGSGGAAARSYDFYINTTGKLGCEFSVNGLTPITVASTNACSFQDGAVGWVRVTRAASTGEIAYFESSDGAVWTSLGGGVGTSGSLFDNAEGVRVGLYGSAVNTLPLAGKIYRAIIKNGIDGTTVVDFNPADADGDGDTSFASSTTGETWTINRSGGLPAQIVGRAAILFNGTSHYLKTNAFTLNQPEWVLWVGKQVSWTSGDALHDGNTSNAGALLQSGSSPQLRAGAGSFLTANGNAAVDALVVVSTVFNGASSSFRVNNTAATTGDAGASAMGGFTLGARGDGTAQHSNIQVYEVALFPIAPSTAQLDRLIAGLMARHSIS